MRKILVQVVELGIQSLEFDVHIGSLTIITLCLIWPKAELGIIVRGLFTFQLLVVYICPQPN